MDTQSYWQNSARLPSFPDLRKDLRVDVAIVGGGITGLSTAYLLRELGCSVAVLERGRCGGFDTSHTTAHLTYVTDTPLRTLVKSFGKERAALAWEAGRAAIRQITRNVTAEGIECNLQSSPGYYHAPIDGSASEELDALTTEALTAQELGFDATYLSSVPVLHQPGVRFAEQGQFHPLRYLEGLVRAITEKSERIHIFENSAATEIKESPLTLRVGSYKVSCDFLIVATHCPMGDQHNPIASTLFQTKQFLFTSYVIGGALPGSDIPPACFWDTAEPYHYLRIQRFDDIPYAIYGGEDHKTGQASNTTEPFGRLETHLGRILPEIRVDHRWSGQVIETSDGLPYIGCIGERHFVSTGFAGNGMTFGTLAAMMAVDFFQGRENAWARLFDPHRKIVQPSAALEYARENKDYPIHLLKDRLSHAPDRTPESVGPGEGAVLEVDKKKMAVYRDTDGALFVHSAVCTHMGCLVTWNEADQTWDCPCHGSRFAPTGEVLAGPAQKGLNLFRVTQPDKPVPDVT